MIFSRLHHTVCLMDEVQDIRERAAAILRNYFRPPSDFLLVLYRIGFQLCDSPKFQRSECGATILQLVVYFHLFLYFGSLISYYYYYSSNTDLYFQCIP